MVDWMISKTTLLVAAGGIALIGSPALAQPPPQDLQAPVRSNPQNPVPPQPQTVDQAFGDIKRQPGEVVQAPPPPPKPILASWKAAQARELVSFADGIAAEGLDPKDYRLAELKAAIAAGEGEALDAAASLTFQYLVEDLRDGRTPMEDRRQWFVVDPDPDRMPTQALLDRAVEGEGAAKVLAALNPVNPDYARLKAELATAKDPARRKLIRANMDRWRWLPQALGKHYLLTNIPEQKLRLTVNNRIIKSYRTIVGKPGRTATPQLAEMVEAVIYNPTWTVPQSIVKGEGLGAKVLGNPGWARANGYKGTKGSDGMIYVVQQPGPNNSLGLMKLDMPNEHAIFLHDTPARGLFAQENRALSHGCVRVENAREVAMTMSMLGNMKTKDDIPVIQAEVQQITASGKYTRYPLANQWPVYLTYFTMASDVDGKMTAFSDIYGRDAPVLASFDKPRQANRARKTDEAVVEIVDDLKVS
jgi:murein L,D-transpeptidase YcbB/YkuD